MPKIPLMMAVFVTEVYGFLFILRAEFKGHLYLAFGSLFS